ncbi:MAG: Flp family type IVb pilin [Nocardioides sp.]
MRVVISFVTPGRVLPVGRLGDERRSERGASVLEWALIAAVMVVAASIIGAVVYNIVQDKSTELESCANQPVGSRC